ncbi:MAG TPA: polysaccharide deacetylase family protein [Bradyrhizobium sp.]|uniref:polysaccharide deacetylase family protein n=1 Tax=Bradyrhizobium sp. TaxID=376 RepID=UPI002D1C62E9|nr:polysaccharide deacetylase family protein [Bradyrhizobium sp.]HLZ06444.1 polysaccharide deacetylase family protein [Bradyrhizobium sp.]
MPSDNPILTSLKLELAYFTGQAWQSREVGGAGVILKFERVIPRRAGRFQPLKANEVSPKFLDRTIRALKRWKYDFVTMDEVCRRAVILAQRRRFVCLTFDGCYKDLARAAYPILRQHGVPFTVYVPTAFPDGVGEPWWLALEQVIAQEGRLNLIIDRKEQHYSIRTPDEKTEAFTFLSSWLRQLPPEDLSSAIHDLCRRYSVNLAALTRETMIDWADLTRIAADPLVTIGSATVNCVALSSLKNPDALREMTMGKAVAEAAFQRDIKHFAFPFGDRDAFGRAHVVMARDVGFSSAVSTIPGIVDTAGRTNLYALPRIAWDGRITSLRAMRVLLSGAKFAPVRPTPKPEI